MKFGDRGAVELGGAAAGACQPAYGGRSRDHDYRHDLALVHHLGFGFHAEACVPAVLKLLELVPAGNGVVLEFGCGTGLLTRHLVEPGTG